MQSVIDRLAFSLSTRNRAKKFKQFLSHLNPRGDETIVDIGVNTEEYSLGDNFLEKHYAFPGQITAVALGNDFIFFHRAYPLVKTVSANGTKLPFEDNAFDIAYSNAVVEHVGTSSEQIKFLKEMLRVARRGYLTTPNRYFPIEIHTRVPLLHLFLPKKWFDQVLVWIGKEWATGNYMHLLSRSQLKTLAESAELPKYHILTNRLLGIPLTYTLIWTKD